MEKLRDLVVQEQLLCMMPADVRIWVSERKPKSSTEAAELADSYSTYKQVPTSKEASKRGEPDRASKDEG